MLQRIQYIHTTVFDSILVTGDYTASSFTLVEILILVVVVATIPIAIKIRASKPYITEAA
jgi:hypothetical protein